MFSHLQAPFSSNYSGLGYMCKCPSQFSSSTPFAVHLSSEYDSLSLFFALFLRSLSLSLLSSSFLFFIQGITTIFVFSLLFCSFSFFVVSSVLLRPSLHSLSSLCSLVVSSCSSSSLFRVSQQQSGQRRVPRLGGSGLPRHRRARIGLYQIWTLHSGNEKSHLSVPSVVVAVSY